MLSKTRNWSHYTCKWWLILLNRKKHSESVRTIEELSLEFILQTFKCHFQNFLLKANQQFLEMLPTTYILQSRNVCNIAGKGVRCILSSRINCMHTNEIYKRELEVANSALWPFIDCLQIGLELSVKGGRTLHLSQSTVWHIVYQAWPACYKPCKSL